MTNGFGAKLVKLALAACLAACPAAAWARSQETVQDAPAQSGNVQPGNAAPQAGAAAQHPVTPQVDTSHNTEQNTYSKEEILAAATGFFGKTSKGLAQVIEKAFADLGRPNAYIVGSELSGAIGIGLRYGDGEMFHKVEGQRKVYWRGPSLGFDLGANGAKTFTLVYNLYDAEDIYRRYPGVDGSFYYVAGVGMNYQQRDNVVLAPIRTGVGLRLGANIGYLHYAKESGWLPF